MAITFRLSVLFLVVNKCTSLLCLASPVVNQSATTTNLKIAFTSDVSTFFLEHYSLNSCATSVVFNNSCPGSRHDWHAPKDYVQLKALCSAFATFSSCLRKSICQVCSESNSIGSSSSSNNGSSNGTSATSAYCAEKPNGFSAIRICEKISFSNNNPQFSSEQPLLLLAVPNFVSLSAVITVLLISIIATLYLLIFK